MMQLAQAIVAEGRYDRMKLSRLFDAPIVETGGFNLFHSADTQALIRRFAQGPGILVLTDSDPAGLRIRAFVNELARGGRVWNAYIPELPGRERRKAHPGAAGLLGVEGVPDAVLLAAVADALRQSEEAAPHTDAVTVADFFAAGLTGSEDSALRRRDFLRAAGLPGALSPRQALRYLNAVLGPVELRRRLAALPAQTQPER